MATQELTGASGAGTVTPFPAIAPGHHLAPVGLGAPGDEPKIVFVPCADWCRTNHITDWVRFIEDITHTGEEFAIQVPSFTNGGEPVYTLTAVVGSDPMSGDPRMREAHVIVGDEGSVGAYLTPDMADGVAAQMEKFAAKVREAARTARLHNAHAEVAA